MFYGKNIQTAPGKNSATGTPSILIPPLFASASKIIADDQQKTPAIPKKGQNKAKTIVEAETKERRRRDEGGTKEVFQKNNGYQQGLTGNKTNHFDQRFSPWQQPAALFYNSIF